MLVQMTYQKNVSVFNVKIQANHVQNNYGMWMNNEDSRSYFVHCPSSHSRESNGSIFVYKRIVHGCFSMPFRFLFSLSYNREGRHDHSVKSVLISKYAVFSGPYFPMFGQEKAPYLDTFDAVDPNE